MPAPNVVAPIAVGLDSAGVVHTDAACRKCSYNVRGLPMTGRCPECRTPVGLAVHGDLLRYSMPKWVQTLRRGVKSIVTGLAVMVIGVMILLCFTLVVAFMKIGGPMATAIPLTLMALCVIVGYVFMLVGSWLLTEPDPSGIGEDRYGTQRKIIRVSLLVGIANILLSIAQQSIAMPPLAYTTLQFVAFASAVFGVVGLFALLSYLSKLATRIPDPKLSERASFLMYALGISYSAFIGMGLIGQLLGGPRSPAVAALSCFNLVIGLLVLIFGIRYLVMLEKFGKAFKEQAALSEQIWGQEAT